MHPGSRDYYDFPAYIIIKVEHEMASLKDFLCKYNVHLTTQLVKASFNKARFCTNCASYIDQAAGERVEKEIEFFRKINEEANALHLKGKPHEPHGDGPDAA